MIYCRFEHDGGTKQGTIENDIINEIRGSFYTSYEYTGIKIPVNQVRLLAPCTPGYCQYSSISRNVSRASLPEFRWG